MHQHQAVKFLQSHGVAHLKLLRELQDTKTVNGVKDLGYVKVNVSTLTIDGEHGKHEVNSMQQLHAYVIDNYVLQKA